MLQKLKLMIINFWGIERSNGNIYFFLIGTLIKNWEINIVLVLFLLLFFLSNNEVIFNISLGIVGSAFAAFNLIDAYNHYKNRNAKITIISNLLSETSLFLNIIIDIMRKVINDEIEKFPAGSEEKRLALKITGLQLASFNCGYNLKYETVEELKKIFVLFCQFCKKVRLGNKNIDFDNARTQLRKIEGIITSYWAMINDENLINSYTELCLIGSSLSEPYQYDDVIEVENDMNTLRANFYTIINCYESLLNYATSIQNYIEPRNNKYFGFIVESLNKEIDLEN